ncbi:MAG: hypothetical protein ACRDDH_11280 [Cetobacterium sp.]|uniref:hypothetical protein n=1 Tax=Cetobacterium sp. TaxID=2071632 RepID=UPI003EE501F2
MNKVQQLNIPGDYDPLKLINNYLEVDLSTYFSEISTVVVTPNVIQSQTTLSTTVTEAQITGTIVRVKFLMLNTSGSLIVPTSSFRFSINVSGILK